MLPLFSVAVRARALPLDEGWELRLFPPGPVDAFFRRHFSPCALWDDRWLAIDALGEHRFDHLPTLRAWLSAQHGLASPSAAHMRALVRWFAPPHASPHAAPCAAP